MPRPRHVCDCPQHQAMCRESRKKSGDRWKRNREQGLCGSCGERQPSEGKAECDDCLRTKRIKKRLSQRAGGIRNFP